MEFDYLVFIGRFQPFHNGHQEVIRHAATKANHIIVLVGSADTPRTTKNPFTFEERKAMIEASLSLQPRKVDLNRLTVLPLHDHLYNENMWVAQVQRRVHAVAGPRRCANCEGTGTAMNKECEPEDCMWCAGRGSKPVKVGIIGQEKDASSYYLRSFPQWPLVPVMHTESLSATDLRDFYFDDTETAEGSLLMAKPHMPQPVQAALAAFRKTDQFHVLLVEYKHLKDYKKAWAQAPYPPTFVTVDSVVTHSGHVLLVRRRAAPGRGLWAIPGGFLNAKEHLFAACLRELQEETQLKLPEKVLKGSLKSVQVFDHPDRSQRGRTITHAYHFDFPDGGALPKVKGSDDAEKARWFPISDALAMGPQLFEDHLHILGFFLHRG